MKIQINCPTCSAPLDLETQADQSCDVHHWHADSGDATICAACRLEWVVHTTASAWPPAPNNRDCPRGDRVLLVNMRGKS